MKPVIGQCPICQDTLHVTRLHCRNCDTGIEGHFTLGRLYTLTPEQLDFVETFIRCEGKIKWVEKELNMSYPAVRARLSSVIEAMGYEVGMAEEKGISSEVRQQILADLSSGKLTTEEALGMLKE
jgi:hypothetical protein